MLNNFTSTLGLIFVTIAISAYYFLQLEFTTYKIKKSIFHEPLVVYHYFKNHSNLIDLNFNIKGVKLTNKKFDIFHKLEYQYFRILKSCSHTGVQSFSCTSISNPKDLTILFQCSTLQGFIEINIMYTMSHYNKNIMNKIRLSQNNLETSNSLLNQIDAESILNNNNKSNSNNINQRISLNQVKKSDYLNINLLSHENELNSKTLLKTLCTIKFPWVFKQFLNRTIIESHLELLNNLELAMNTTMKTLIIK